MFWKNEFIMSIIRQVAKAACAVVFSIAVIIFLKGKIITISHSLAEQKVTAYVLMQRSENIQLLQKELRAAEGVDRLLSSARPSADNIVDFKASLESLASRHALEQSLNFGLPNADETAIDYTITLNGNINTLVDYLNDFERLPFLTSISSVLLQPPGSSWSGNSVINMNARVYTRPVAD